MAATNDSHASQPPAKVPSNKSKIQVIDMKQEERLATNMSNLTIANPITTDDNHTEKEPSRTHLTTLKSSVNNNVGANDLHFDASFA